MWLVENFPNKQVRAQTHALSHSLSLSCRSFRPLPAQFAEAVLLVAAGEPGLAVSRLFRLAKYKLMASSTFILKKNATGLERYSRTNKILKYSIWGAFATSVWYLKELGYIGEITSKLGGLFGFVTLKNIFKWLATWAYWGPAYPLV